MRNVAVNKDLEYSSVQKAIGILLSFIPDNKAMGNLELSKSLGMNKSTISRLTQYSRSSYRRFLANSDTLWNRGCQLGRPDATMYSSSIGRAVPTYSLYVSP